MGGTPADQDRAAAAQGDASARSRIQSSTPGLEQGESNKALNIKTPKMPGTTKHKKSKSTQNLKSRVVQDKIKMIR